MFAQVVFNLPANGSFTYEIPDTTACVPGVRVVAPFGSRTLTGFVLSVSEERGEGDFAIKPIERVVDREPLFSGTHTDLARWMEGMYLCSLGEAISAMIPSGKRESDLPVFPDETEAYVPHGQSDEQKAAVGEVVDGSGSLYYLYGMTGSGKTEVYLSAAERILERGRGVIYLVPEISLTHQLIRHLQSRFGGKIAVLHSHLTPSQRLLQWTRILHGEARFVVGARSAVFAPVGDLGLIVIDEEHEGSYKSGSTPRYHARQVAMKRCAMSGARLLMGSATPSVEAYHLMAQGTLKRLDLRKRLSGGKPPEIDVVDMKKEGGTISRLLAARIREVKNEGKQSILFLNRRGFSYFFHCRSCGYEMKCRRCSVSLTYHKAKGRMICHYCGLTEKPVDVCPECGSLDVGYSGFGTELVEEEIRRMFPDLSVARLDTDTTVKRGSMKKVLEDFEAGRIDLLLGTQMVAKGLNFPGVKLVGIVLADTTLHLPDFRAPERTFALVVQVAGRAGRYSTDGTVIIQTYKPENDAIRYAASDNPEEFYPAELAMRREMGFPPFSRLFRIVFRGKDRARTEEASEAFARELVSMGVREGECLGPAEAPIAIIAGNYRFQLTIRSARFGQPHGALSRLYREYRFPSGVYAEIDVDPVSLL